MIMTVISIRYDRTDTHTKNKTNNDRHHYDHDLIIIPDYFSHNISS